MRHKFWVALCAGLFSVTAWATVPVPPSLTPLPPADAALLHKVHGFVWGAKTAPAKAIVFFDPNCLWCHRFFAQVQAGVAAGKARYLMIPVAILKKSSLPKAERILQSPDPQKTFLQDETHFNVRTEEGGLPQTFTKARKATADLAAINTAVLADLEGGKPGTPTFVVSTPNGPALHEGFISKRIEEGGAFWNDKIPVPKAHPIVLPPVPKIAE